MIGAFGMNADNREAELISRRADKGSLRVSNSGSLAFDLLKPVAIIIASNLLKPGG